MYRSLKPNIHAFGNLEQDLPQQINKMKKKSTEKNPKPQKNPKP